METLEWLYSLEGRGSVLGLDKIQDLLEKIGNPQNGLKIIHVAGTNGKGSVCAMIASILQEQGYKTGLYTSPHLKKFNERIKINGTDISDNDLKRLTERIKPFVTDQTFFEVTTALAFLYFKENNIEIAIIEVGLGGRLDATNIITPLISVITNISLEHTEILGETEEKIAFEKAGIIKKNTPLVTLAEKQSLDVIKKIAEEKNAEIFIPEIIKISPFELKLKGEFQLLNLSIVLKVIELLNKKNYAIQEIAIKLGLKKVYWPGRMEFIKKNILVDCGHNPACIEVLKNEIRKIRKNYARVISVIGILKEKDKKNMLKDIESFSDYIIFCRPKTERATPPEELVKEVKVKNEVIEDVKSALKKAKEICQKDDLIVVTGSMYVIGEII